MACRHDEAVGCRAKRPHPINITFARVGFDDDCVRYFLALHFVGLQHTKRLPHAAPITNHGVSSLLGTHHQVPAACSVKC